MKTKAQNSLRAHIRDLKRKQALVNSEPDINGFDYWMRDIVKSIHYGKTIEMDLAYQRLI